MKRIFSALLCLLITILSFSSTASAEMRRVVDNAMLLEENEAEELEAYLSEKRSEYEFDIVIVTEYYVDDLESYADDFYDYNGYGIGEEKDGVLLLVTDNGCWLSTTGFGIDAVDPYLSELSSDFHIAVDSNGYFDAFTQFADGVCGCVEFERERIETEEWIDDEEEFFPDGEYFVDEDGVYAFGEEMYYYRPSFSPVKFIVIPLLIGLLFAFIVTIVMKNKLKSVSRKTEANDCVRPGSMRVTASYDNFLYRTTSRSLKPRDDDSNHHNMSSGGMHTGGSVHTGSSGTTHGGGAF